MKKPLVFQSDFGYVDGAVSAMYGVAYGVDPTLLISNLTHEITPYDIWEASYRLIQTVSYWPEGTVFVSVVDPGVGSARRSIVVKTKTGQYIITLCNRFGSDASARPRSHHHRGLPPPPPKRLSE